MVGFVKFSEQWVPCEVIQTKGSKTEVVVEGFTFVVSLLNVVEEMAA